MSRFSNVLLSAIASAIFSAPRSLTSFEYKFSPVRVSFVFRYLDRASAPSAWIALLERSSSLIFAPDSSNASASALAPSFPISFPEQDY